ncbi:M23 family metallopeptidase, partial [candidate division WOR-3 bacterium]|nr:M23 family metallopeptidase [candidate division WOR-3 bacterium]
GDIIGYVGNSGSSTGYHLHFAVKHNNVYINPRRMHFESEIVLNEDQINTYCNYREIIYSLLFATKSFIEFPKYCSKKRYLFEYANIIGKSPNL